MSNKLCKILRKMSIKSCTKSCTVSTCTQVAGTSTTRGCACGCAESASCKCFTQRVSNCPSRPDHYVSPVWDIVGDRVDYSCKVKSINRDCSYPETCRCKPHRPCGQGNVGGCSSCNGCGNVCGCGNCRPCPGPTPPLPIKGCRPPVRITFPRGAAIATNSPIFMGTGKPGSSITVIIDNDPNFNLQAVVDTDGNWVVVPPVGMVLNHGAHTITATMNGRDGCFSSDDSNFFIQTSAMETPEIDYPTGIISDRTPRIVGRGVRGALLTACIVGGQCQTTTVGNDGNWEVVMTNPLADGSYTVIAQQSLGNNVSQQVASGFTVQAQS